MTIQISPLLRQLNIKTQKILSSINIYDLHMLGKISLPLYKLLKATTKSEFKLIQDNIGDLGLLNSLSLNYYNTIELFDILDDTSKLAFNLTNDFYYNILKIRKIKINNMIQCRLSEYHIYTKYLDARNSRQINTRNFVNPRIQKFFVVFCEF